MRIIVSGLYSGYTQEIAHTYVVSLRPSGAGEFILGLFFDGGSVVSGSHHLLRLLRRLIPFIPKEDIAVVVGAIVNSRLDYANALYLGLPKYQIARLQVVQNTATRLMTGKKPWESISPSLRSLHWLPVKDRITFKALTHRCIHGNAPHYLCEKLKVHNPNRILRSTNQNQLQIPKARYKSKGDRRFAVQGPRLWNALPASIRLEENYYGPDSGTVRLADPVIRQPNCHFEPAFLFSVTRKQETPG